MNAIEPLILEAHTMGKWWISQLKNIDVSFIENNIVKKEYKGNTERLLAIFAEDLITINHGDYETNIRIWIEESEVIIKLEQSYPFIAETVGQPVKGLKYSFGLADCGDLKTIHKAIDSEINNNLENSSFSFFHLKTYTNLDHVENYYRQMRMLDNLFFNKPILLPTYSYYGSIYGGKKDIEVRSLKIESREEQQTPMLKLYVGLVKVVITNAGMMIQNINDGNIRKVLKANESSEQQIKEEFVNIYNKSYETNYTDIHDLLLVHDMIEI